MQLIIFASDSIKTALAGWYFISIFFLPCFALAMYFGPPFVRLIRDLWTGADVEAEQKKIRKMDGQLFSDSHETNQDSQ